MKNTVYTTVFSALVLASTSALAADEHGHGDHGSTSLTFNIQGNKAQVELEASTEDVYGLAAQAKSDDEKKKVEAGMSKLKLKIAEVVILDSKLTCKWNQTEANPWVVHGEKKATDKEQHGEVHAKYDVECSGPLTGSKVKFAFKKVMPSVNKVNVKVSNSGKTNNTEIKRDRGAVTL